MTEKRQFERVQIRVTAKIRYGGGRRAIPVVDLSETGCRLIDPTVKLPIGAHVSMRIEQLGPFEATVVWRNGKELGMRFDKHLYGPIFDHIRHRLSS